MGHVEVKREIAAPAEAVWDVLADYGGIHNFNPNVSASRVLEGSPATGVGAQRLCDLADGRNHIRERVTHWIEGRSYSVDIYEGTMPLESATATLGVEPMGASRSIATMRMDYRPKFGPVGWLMDKLMMQRAMARMGWKVLEGLEAYVTRAVVSDATVRAGARR